MRAAFYESKGPASEVLKIGDLVPPAVGQHDVRVQIYVSAVNPSDTKQRAGWGTSKDMEYPLVVPHNDGAGVIVEVGSEVDAGRVGERVWIFEAQAGGRAFGTAADEVVVPHTNAVHLPDESSFEDGASLGIPGMTAWRLLFADGGIVGKTVVVQGGAGSVGHMAVQLARWAGAQVIATVGSDKQAQVARECGAHFVVNYKTDDVVARVTEFLGAPASVDSVLEVALAANLDVDAAMLRIGGTISTYMIDEDASRPPSLNLQQLVPKDITVHFRLIYVMSPEAHRDAASLLNKALRAGALKPRISHRFAIEDIVAAHDLLGTKGGGGKVVLSLR